MSDLARSFDKMLGDQLSPLGDEFKRLRDALRWNKASDPPLHGQAVIVSIKGDQMFAVWREPEDGDPGYWDTDIEYGGTAIEPDLWFQLPPTDNSILPPPTNTERRV